MDNRYDDIIDTVYRGSVTHRKMSLHDRAAQFAPFAALTGYDDAVEETARHTDGKNELNEDEISRIDLILRSLYLSRHQNPRIEVTYFCHDEKKSGGKYLCRTNTLLDVDANRQELVFEDKSRIPFCDIVNIELPE